MRPARTGFAKAVAASTYQLQALNPLDPGAHALHHGVYSRGYRTTGDTARAQGGDGYHVWATQPPQGGQSALVQGFTSVGGFKDHPHDAEPAASFSVTYSATKNTYSVAPGTSVDIGSSGATFIIGYKFRCSADGVPEKDETTAISGFMSCGGLAQNFFAGTLGDCKTCSEFSSDPDNAWLYTGTGYCAGLTSGVFGTLAAHDDASTSWVDDPCAIWDLNMCSTQTYSCAFGADSAYGAVQVFDYAGAVTKGDGEDGYLHPVVYADFTKPLDELSSADSPTGLVLATVAYPVCFRDGGWIGGTQWFQHVRVYDPATCTLVPGLASWGDGLWPGQVSGGQGVFILSDGVALPAVYGAYGLVGSSVVSTLGASTTFYHTDPQGYQSIIPLDPITPCHARSRNIRCITVLTETLHAPCGGAIQPECPIISEWNEDYNLTTNYYEIPVMPVFSGKTVDGVWYGGTPYHHSTDYRVDHVPGPIATIKGGAVLSPATYIAHYGELGEGSCTDGPVDPLVMCRTCLSTWTSSWGYEGQTTYTFDLPLDGLTIERGPASAGTQYRPYAGVDLFWSTRTTGFIHEIDTPQKIKTTTGTKVNETLFSFTHWVQPGTNAGPQSNIAYKFGGLTTRTEDLPAKAQGGLSGYQGLAADQTRLTSLEFSPAYATVVQVNTIGSGWDVLGGAPGYENLYAEPIIGTSIGCPEDTGTTDEDKSITYPFKIYKTNR